jgi:peptidyl-prolyl cis-trans isomerase D
MFQLFRSRTRTLRIMLGVIFGAVILSMVTYLIPGSGGSTSSSSSNDVVLAEVGGDSVTATEASAQFQDYITQQRIPPQAYSFILPKIVDDLVTQKAILQEADRLGLGVTADEMANHLRTQLPFLFPEGGFLGKEQYAAYVQEKFQKSIPEFENLVRNDLIRIKLVQLITDGITVSPQEVEREYRRRNEKARLDYVLLSSSSLQSSVTSTPAELEQYFQKNRATYTLPERRSFKYVVIDDVAVAAKVQMSPQEIESYYNGNRERFRVQDRVRITHILLRTTDKSPEEVSKIEAKAQDLLKQVKAGKDFAALAKANSEDPTSAPKGGEVGWITRGQTVPEFETKAFAMKPGEISDLVKTQYGLHILKALEKESARLKPLEEVAPTIRQELVHDRAEGERLRLADAARAAAARHGQDLDAAAKELGLTTQTATNVQRGAPVPGLGNEPGLTDAIFSAAKGGVVGPIIATGRSVIAVVTDTSPTRPAELAEVAERVKSDCNAAKGRQVAETRAKELADKAKSGDLRAVAREYKLEVKSAEPFTREGSIAGLGSAASFAVAFTAPVGSVQGPAQVGDNYVIYRVGERVNPDTPLSPEEQKIIRSTLLGNRQTEAFEVYREALRARLQKQGKLKIFQDRVDRFVSNKRS